jgi:hypothetical protein
MSSFESGLLVPVNSGLLVPVNKVLTDATHQEFISRALVRRWQNIDQFGTLTLVVTIIGSGAAGVGIIWLAMGWEWIWSAATVVGIAFSIENLWLSTSEKVTRQREFYTVFVVIRRELEKLREDINLGIEYKLAKEIYDKLYDRLNKSASEAANLNISIVYTSNLDRSVTEQLKEHMLKEYGIEIL